MGQKHICFKHMSFTFEDSQCKTNSKPCKNVSGSKANIPTMTRYPQSFLAQVAKSILLSSYMPLVVLVLRVETIKEECITYFICTTYPNT